MYRCAVSVRFPFAIPMVIALSSLTTLGCAQGDIDIDGEKRFGSVSSVLWLDSADILQYWTHSGAGPTLEGGYGRRTVSTIAVYDKNVPCDEQVQGLVRYEAESKALIEAYAEGRFCEAVPGFFTALAEGYEGTKAYRDRLAFYRFTDAGYSWGPGSFELGSATTSTFSADLTRLGKEETSEAYYLKAAESWDVSACAMAPEFWTWAEALGETLALESGVLELTNVEIKEALAGTVEGALEGGGSVSGRFVGEWCDLPEVEVYIDFLP